jgi:Zn-finger domain-containing protein
LNNLGWRQFSNGVQVYTHKEFAIEMFMTMKSVMRKIKIDDDDDEEDGHLSFRLENEEQFVIYQDIRDLLGLKGSAPKSS